jgi:hypothetical protein
MGGAVRSKLSTVPLFAAALFVSALLLAGCGAEGEEVAPAPGEPAPAETAPDETAPDEPLPAEEGVADEEATMVEFEEHDGSGYTGIAIMTPAGDEVYVDIEVRREDEDEAAAGDDDTLEDDAFLGLGAEIRSGSCDDLGDTVQPVARLQFGWGTATLGMSLSELTGGDYVMVISRSETAAAQEAEDPFGEGDAGAPFDEEGPDPTAEVTLEEDREPVACGSIEAGVTPDWGDPPVEDDDGTLDDDEWDDDAGDDG